jgi:hypothetical protein
VGKSPLNHCRGMPLASLIKLLGTRRRELELNNNEKIIVNNYKRPMLNFQSRLKKKNGKFRRGGLLTSIVKWIKVLKV